MPRVLVPLYVWPPDAGAAWARTWGRVIAAGNAAPNRLDVIINPDSGPGSINDPDYRRALAHLGAAKVSMLGYVATGYGKRLLSEAIHDVVAYRMAGIRSIFFDEVATSVGGRTYYEALTRAAGRSIMNPGVVAPKWLHDLASAVVVFEDPAAKWRTIQPNGTNGAAIITGVRTLAAAQALKTKARRCGVESVYCTTGAGKEAYDVIPSYLGSLI